MNRKTALLLLPTLLLGFALGSVTAGDEKPFLAEPLKPFEPYLGKTWRGEFAGSTPDKPTIDISHWERALNGHAIRITHSINDGEYGGESIVMWDAKRKKLWSWYFTTAGFYTEAPMEFKDGAWHSHETVTGNQNGITEVKSFSRLLPDGRMHTKSQYLQNGQWVDGHEIHYVEAPGAKVNFR